MCYVCMCVTYAPHRVYLQDICSYFKVFYYLMCDPGAQKLGYICSNNQQYSVWNKIIHFSFMPKIIRILRSCSMKIFYTFLTINISKLNF